jgi:hypothetical protein
VKGPLPAVLAAGALAAAPAASARGNQLRATVTLAGPEGTATATVALARFS